MQEVKRCAEAGQNSPGQLEVVKKKTHKGSQLDRAEEYKYGPVMCRLACLNRGSCHHADSRKSEGLETLEAGESKEEYGAGGGQRKRGPKSGESRTVPRRN